MTQPLDSCRAAPRLFDAAVVENIKLCREHYRLVLAGANLSGALPGQFVHICPTNPFAGDDWNAALGTSWSPSPLLRRAFSIAGLRSSSRDACEFDLIYRVAGTATRWMETLRAGDRISVLGPLGNSFPIRASKRHAWLVGGGVGLPPMLWLAQWLHDADRRAVAFVGARGADLLALTVSDPGALSGDARKAALSAVEFALHGTPVVMATDDGSIGFHGHVPNAMAAHWNHAGVDSGDLVVYACGPERMMEAVGRFCIARSIECHLCMERSMACGTGTCQSCVVAVAHGTSPDGWRYELCCTQGPVFDATRVIWPSDAGDATSTAPLRSRLC